MKIYTMKDIAGIGLIITMIYLIGYCAGFGFALDLTSGDLDTIVSDHDALVDQMDEERVESIKNMTAVCDALFNVSDRICEERVNNAFIAGVSLCIPEDVENDINKE